MRKIKTGDNVVVITGPDKGKRGDVARIVDDTHVVVNGINAMKKHAKPNPLKNQPGGIITKEMPIHVSNIAIWNPVTQKPDRIGFRTLDDGRKLRFYKSNGEQINGRGKAKIDEEEAGATGVHGQGKAHRGSAAACGFRRGRAP